MNEPDYLDLLDDEESERREIEQALEDEAAGGPPVVLTVNDLSKLAREPRTMAAKRGDRR